MTFDLCTRSHAAACVGEDFCASLHLTDEEACRLAAESCHSWWQKRDEMAEADDLHWVMSIMKIDALTGAGALLPSFLHIWKMQLQDRSQ